MYKKNLTDLENADNATIYHLLPNVYVHYAGSDPPSTEVPEGEYPHVIKKDNGKTALCMQAYRLSKYISNLSVTFDRVGDVTSWSGNPVLLDSTIFKGT